jgi:polysaccharide transporter, PST family
VALAYQPLIIAIGLLYMSQNRPREVVRASIIDVILTVLSLAIGLPFGVVGVAVALVTVGVAIRTPIAFYLATRAGPVRQTDIYTTIAPAVLAALPVAASVWLLRSEAPDLISEPLGAVASAFTLAVIVAAATYCTMPKTRRAMIGLVRLPRLLSDTGEA